MLINPGYSHLLPPRKDTSSGLFRTAGDCRYGPVLQPSQPPFFAVKPIKPDDVTYYSKVLSRYNFSKDGYESVHLEETRSVVETNKGRLLSTSQRYYRAVIGSSMNGFDPSQLYQR